MKDKHCSTLTSWLWLCSRGLSFEGRGACGFDWILARLGWGDELRITLWGNYVRSFDVVALQELSSFVIVVFAKFHVSKLLGHKIHMRASIAEFDFSKGGGIQVV
ncbi:hypothetical protein NC652_018937 [Populus alba x Populus x berolinensis]|nr:hypothetical protein NC652_018937 [Populus alba x Populus x berolinensis]